MFPSKTFLSLILISLSAVGASPLTRQTSKFTIPIKRTTFPSGVGFATLPERDLARLQALKQSGQLTKRQTIVSIPNNGVAYTTEVGVGVPPTTYTLLIDTGSSNTFVGANQKYVQTESSVSTGNNVTVKYGSGGFSGQEWLDSVTLSPELTIISQSIGVAEKSNGFKDVDGILGVGPVDLTKGTVEKTDEVPTIMDNLYSQGTIGLEVLGVFFVPKSEDDSTGSLTFGGFDGAAIVGDVGYVPITSTSPASEYWGIDQSIQYGDHTIMSQTAGIVDTGSTLILLATEAFDEYKSVTGGVLDSATGLLSITPEQYANLMDLTFNINGKSWTLIPNAQIWPRSLNTDIGGKSDGIYLIVSDAKTKFGEGLDFINGYAFLERFYSIHDTTNRQVGFAETKYTRVETN